MGKRKIAFVVSLILMIVSSAFVGIYGLLLAGPGAIVLTEHYIFPRIGLQRYWAHRKHMGLSWPAAVAWLGSIALAQQAADKIATSQFYVFKNKGHHVQYTAQAEFCDLLDNFLNSR